MRHHNPKIPIYWIDWTYTTSRQRSGIRNRPLREMRLFLGYWHDVMEAEAIITELAEYARNGDFEAGYELIRKHCWKNVLADGKLFEPAEMESYRFIPQHIQADLDDDDTPNAGIQMFEGL